MGWLWWLQLVVVIAAEPLGAAGLLATTFPALPVWLMAFVFIVVLTAVNLTIVKNFGEFEFWFALLKVAAIIGFLTVGFLNMTCCTGLPQDFRRFTVCRHSRAIR